MKKELLSEVLGKEAEYDGLTKEGTVLVYKLNGVGMLRTINIHELAFRTRDYFKTKSKHLSLNQSIEDIFKEANSIYEDLSDEGA